jgi:hypothetical protein
VHGPKRKAAARQGSIDRLYAEGQDGRVRGMARRRLHDPAELGQWY